MSFLRTKLLSRTSTILRLVSSKRFSYDDGASSISRNFLKKHSSKFTKVKQNPLEAGIKGNPGGLMSSLPSANQLMRLERFVQTDIAFNQTHHSWHLFDQNQFH